VTTKVCPFVHSFGSVSKLDSEPNPFIRCVALLNEQVYSTNLVFHYSLMLSDNGDTDPCVSYEGTVTAVKRIGFEEVDGGGYRPWFYNQAKASLEILAEKAPLFGPNLLAQPMGAQMGGEVVNYEHGLSFLTVHGSGHMVPQFRPQAALHMLDRLVSFQDLSPLMPSNATLMELSPEEFSKTMNKWTDEAMSSPYVDGVAGDDHATAEEAED
jgi:hypothetical protein